MSGAGKTAHCPRCRGGFSIPEVTSQEWLQVIEADQAGSKVMAMKLLRQFSKSEGLVDCKATILHLSRAGNLCHRCNQPILREDPYATEIVCGKCRSLNILR